MTEPLPLAEPLPLEGVRVLDLTSVVAGPSATLRLADMGAEVIKIETLDGDLLRTLGGASKSGSLSPKFMHFNRSKRSVALDLKHPQCRPVLERLLGESDIFITNIRPESLGRLGLDAATCLAKHPKLIHCIITGFGPGPYRGRPAYDTVIQGAAGVAGLFIKRDGRPSYAPFLLADHVVGEVTAGAITAMLFRRSRTGRGGELEIPMMETLAAFVLQEHLGGATFRPARGESGDSRILAPDNLPIATADGWVSVTCNTDPQVHAFLKAVGRQELLDDPRFKTVAARFAASKDWFAMRADALKHQPTAYWLRVLTEAGVPVMPCHSIESLLEDPHLVTTGLLQHRDHPVEGPIIDVASAVRFDGQASATGFSAQTSGQDTHAVLQELGFGEDDIEALFQSGVIGGGKTTEQTRRASK
ncbi:CoA transferase [Methylocella sp. CPCC 101449]|uniref:CaiB/BaiF CoA transferase family protein n=1 Tax=Methylocella sp. CPCC 101449 TaxID=2987531 RepID=UPI00288F6861|nr:CoA transferase [Methylocella sp. CPCC 101449]MDT2024031.1 CoA transferase [Methylocella sp. CPCC 101449]